jgi:Cu/Zn superoxide dismutase
MDRRASLAAAVALSALAVAAVAPRYIKLSSAEAAAPPATAKAAATAELVGPGGVRFGTATLDESPRGVLIRVQARGLPPAGTASTSTRSATAATPSSSARAATCTAGPRPSTAC